MISITPSPLRRDRRSSIGTAGLLVALALLGLALQSSAAAQAKVITTVTPLGVEPSQGANQTFETTGTVALRFQPPTLPHGAKVSKANLQLSCSDMKNGADGSTRVNIIFGANTKLFGSRSFNKTIPGTGNPVVCTGNPLLWNATAEALSAINANTGASFQLELVSKNGARGWYSVAADSKLRPRLILEYEVSGWPAVVQTEAIPATHSPRPFLPNPTEGAQFNSRSVANVQSYAPVFYNGLTYLIAQNQLQALRALGGPPVWSVSLTNPGQHLLLSNSGRVYVVGNNQILVYQLDPTNSATPATEVKTLGGQLFSPKSVPNLNPTLAPAVGQDGSLYFVNGQEVYALNADLQELWKVTLEGPKTSRVTVGPSSQFVYLLGKKDGAMALIAIDARTGDASIAKLSNSDQLKSIDNPTLHAPVVLLHSDGTEKIYVAANSLNDGVLAAFDNPKTTVTGRDRNLIETEQWTPLHGLFSQPTASVGGARKIYSVQVTGSNGQLKAIDWLNGDAEPVGATFPVNASSFLLNGGNLAVDQAGNVLVWNGAEAKLYAFAPGGASVVSAALVVGPADASLMVFGSDGTLYAADAPNAANRTLRAIVPQYTLIDSSSATISSPTHLRVEGTVNKDTTLTASGSVLVGADFKVKQGKTLTVRTNGPK
jgi:hypothetical protein